MPDLYLLFSHTLTSKQIEEAKTRLMIDNIIYLPAHLQKIWSNIPAEESIDKDISKFIKYLGENSKSGDYVLVEGDFGATFAVVDWCIVNSRIPIYATTARLAKSEGEGDFTKMTHYFKHVMFRRYTRYR